VAGRADDAAVSSWVSPRERPSLNRRRVSSAAVPHDPAVVVVVVVVVDLAVRCLPWPTKR
jgi:hypothetical protein